MSSCEPEAQQALCKHTVEVVDLFCFHCTIQVVAINRSLCLLQGPGERTASGPVHPAVQQPPNLCLASQPDSSGRLRPSADAPSSAQQWTLKTAGVRAEDPPSRTKQMGGPAQFRGKWTARHYSSL